MEYKNMRVMEVKALTRDCELRNYSRMRKPELVALLQKNPPPTPCIWLPHPNRAPPPAPQRHAALTP